MTDDELSLCGMPLEQVVAALEQQGIVPQITVTCAPRRTEDSSRILRVIRVNDGGRKLTVARFYDVVSNGD